MDFTNASNVILFFQNNGYMIIFLIMILEGPIVTFAASFAASLGMFNPFVIFCLAVVANLIGDIIWYFVGRVGSLTFIFRILHRFRLTSGYIKRLKSHLKNYPFKSILVIKFAPLLPVPGIIFAGVVQMPFLEFCLYVLVIGIPVAAVIVAAGFYSGIAFNLIARYLKFGELFILGLILLLWLIWKAFRKIANFLEKKFSWSRVPRPRRALANTSGRNSSRTRRTARNHRSNRPLSR